MKRKESPFQLTFEFGVPPTTKRCKDCSKDLLLEENFYVKRTTKTGAKIYHARCKKCFVASRRSYLAAYKKAHPEQIRAERARHRARHREELRKKNLEYISNRNVPRKTYPLTLHGRIYKRIWKAKNKALRKQAKGSFTKEQFFLRCEYYEWCCYLCGTKVSIDTVNIEHRIPLSRNGTNWPANLAPACPECNNRKGSKTEIEYRIWAGIHMYSYYLKTHAGRDLPL